MPLRFTDRSCSREGASDSYRWSGQTGFDGNGNLTQLDAVADNGNLDPSWHPNTGTYSLNRDCTGTMTVSNGDRPAVHLLLIVSQSGNTIRDMVIDPGFATTAEAERIQAPGDEDGLDSEASTMRQSGAGISPLVILAMLWSDRGARGL